MSTNRLTIDEVEFPEEDYFYTQEQVFGIADREQFFLYSAYYLKKNPEAYKIAMKATNELYIQYMQSVLKHKAYSLVYTPGKKPKAVLTPEDREEVFSYIQYSDSYLQRLRGYISGQVPMPAPKVITSKRVKPVSSHKRTVPLAQQHVDAIKTMNLDFLRSSLAAAPQTLSWADTKQFLKQVNLNEFLGFGASLDKIESLSPRMIVFPPSEQNQDWMCHHDDKESDIFGLVTALSGKDFKDSVDFLAQCYNITILRSDCLSVDLLIKKTNRSLASIAKEENREALKLVSKTLKGLQKVASETAKIVGKDGYADEAYFSASKRFLAKQAGASDSTVFSAINLLAALGIIVKVADADLPASIVERDKEFREKLVAKFGEAQTIQYFLLVNISTLPAMQTIRTRLDAWAKAKGCFSKISESYLGQIFGPELAAMIYPKKRSKAKEEIAKVG